MKSPFRYRFVAAALLALGIGFSPNMYAASASAAAAAHGSLPAASEAASSSSASISSSIAQETIILPGPLRSFLRLAGISQEVAPSEVLPMLARNVFLHGYQDGKPTEFLILIERYLRQARELQAQAVNGEIRVANCADAGQLLRALGYQFEHGCSRGSTSLITGDAELAFLTVDSGFPITELEKSLNQGQPFVYRYPATRLPVLLRRQDWLRIDSARKRADKARGNDFADDSGREPDADFGADFIYVLLHDENLGRLYSAMARLEPRTRDLLAQSPGLKALLPYAAALDFYGGEICIPGHAVSVPGGELAEASWEELAGASPRQPGRFVLHLVSHDRGWLAAYFDALSRIGPEQQRRFAQGQRTRDLYEAYRSTAGSTDAASGVYPRNANLLLLLSQMHWQPDGQPLIPGNVAVWAEAFERQARSYGYRNWTRRARSIRSPESFLEAVAASANMSTVAGPEQMYLMLSAIDSRRPGNRLSPETVRLLASRFDEYQDWYSIFADFPELDGGAMAQFIATADHVGSISNPALRANALGAFQAEVGLWKILARQGEIPAADVDASWRKTIEPFAAAGDSIELFMAARASLDALSAAAGGSANPSQDEIVDLLAGPRQSTADGIRVHEELARRIRAVLDDQRLVSLDTLFGLFDGLDSMAHGAKLGDNLLPLAEDLHGFEMPRPIFTGGERTAWAPHVYTSRHAELQVQTDLAKIIRDPRSPAQLEAARGRLTPFLRDTLVGLNYAYDEPPGAQVLHNNPLFVRSHDFSISSIQGKRRLWDAPELIGVGATAGGGAYLMGSLSQLPYALASAEENFIVPEHVQALIWQQTVPQLLVEAVLPRWWNVSRNEMHAAALYQRAGDELLAAARTHSEARSEVLEILSNRFTVERLEKLEERMDSAESAGIASRQLLPADAFYLAVHFRARFAKQAAKWGPACRELDALVRKDPDETSPDRIAHDFGAPHPVFADSDIDSLLGREPFPVSGGDASRLFGECWESNNLYWARLADEKGYPPVMLNVLVPLLTRRMVANIFATYVDDWPALERAMLETGAEFQRGALSAQEAFGYSAGSGSSIGSASE